MVRTVELLDWASVKRKSLTSYVHNNIRFRPYSSLLLQFYVSMLVVVRCSEKIVIILFLSKN